MTPLLTHALSKAKKLSASEQNALGAVILTMTDTPEMDTLDVTTRQAILQGLADAETGNFVSEAELDALWKRFGA
jgi:hypothetical protein